jgi:hypothetical protein
MVKENNFENICIALLVMLDSLIRFLTLGFYN